MNQPLDPTRKFLLSVSVAASFIVHTGFLLFLQSHSLWFYSHTTPHVAGINTPWLQLLEKTPRDKILEEAFEKPTPHPQASLALHPQPEPTLSQLLHPTISLPEPPPLPTALPTTFPTEQLLVNKDLFPIRTFALPSLPTIDLFSDLPADLIIPAARKANAAPSFHPQQEKSLAGHLSAETPLVSQAPPAPTISFSEPASPSSELQEVALPKPLPTLPMPQLPQLPTLADLETVNLSDCFESEIVFLPREEGGHLFAITLLPRPDLDLPRLRQNVCFLIDRSNSIQRDRLIATKNAVEKAIGELDADDTFNILIFDSKVEKLFPTLTPATTDALVQAEIFLDKISLGSFFTPPDIYKPLLLALPAEVQDDELYTTILLSDGENLSKKSFQRTILNDWTLRNNGRSALYAIGMSSDQHLATLDAACAFNKGRLSSSTTNRGLKRKLLKLIKNIHTPVAKDIAAKAISRGPAGHIEIYPKSSRAPNLYLGQPYVILGTTDTLDDFILFVQGRLKDRWINLKKTVSFLHARRGGHTLKAEWALQQAYREYEQYVLDDNPRHLEVAQTLLKPFDLQAAFE